MTPTAPQHSGLPEKSTVAVIGLGYVGICIAAALADR